MKRTAKWAGIGAACGLAIVTVFATGEMLGSPGHPETAVVIILALAMGGLLVGVPAGAALGVIAALLTRRRGDSPGLRAATPAPSPAPLTPAQVPTPPVQSPPAWLSTPGEQIGMTATVLSVQPVAIPKAARASDISMSCAPMRGR